MDRRLKLQEELTDILDSNSVYWQPPESVKMSYPAIVYEEHVNDNLKADNKTYVIFSSWDVTVIRPYKNRDETKKILGRLAERFKYCRHASHFVSDNLIHDVYQIYF